MIIIFFGWETGGVKVVFLVTVSFVRWIHQIVMVMVGLKRHFAKMVIHLLLLLSVTTRQGGHVEGEKNTTDIWSRPPYCYFASDATLHGSEDQQKHFSPLGKQTLFQCKFCEKDLEL